MFLCYGSPASMNYIGWENEALPLGNGRIGAKVFGGTQCELISFNEKTLWSGGKDSENFSYGISNADNGKALKEVQSLLAAGKQKEATTAMKNLQGNLDAFGAYQSFGNLYLNFGTAVKADNYVRDLDLDSASSMVTYKIANTVFTRHYFVNYPSNVFVGRIESEAKDEKAKASFDIDAYFISDQKGQPYSKGNTIYLEGTVNANDGIDAPAGKDKNNMKYGAAIKFIAKDGEVEAKEDGHIFIKDTTSVVIIASFATDYVNEYPIYKADINPLEAALSFVENAATKTFSELYREHLKDYKELYDRVKFTLGEEESTQATDYMLKRFEKNGGEYKRNLITLLFQYGRYLLISSSRGNTLPANLQGIWNAKNNPIWSSDYHLNINLQMNYWPAYVANLAETALPYIDFINSLRKPGRVVAKKTMGIGELKDNGEVDYNKATGWVVHTMVNPLGVVAPGSNWRWGWAPVNGAWATQGMFDYYRFTKDTEKLKNDIYPAMQESALLWSQLLIEDKKSGRLVVSPCFSPEQGPVTAGGTYEQSIIYNLFDSVIKGANVLLENGYESEVDLALIEKIKEQKEKLKPYSIGKNGQIKEWEQEDTWGALKKKKLGISKNHRHISHLLGVYPFDQITKDKHILYKGAKISLAERGIKTTGWALSHRLLCHARLGNGKMCDEVIEQIIKTMILKNLFGNHPPFQIDCNFGFTAGVCEMLLQSSEDCIKVLPALPKSWHSGEISGLMARGNFELSLKWQDSKLKEGTVKSNLGGLCCLYYDSKVMLVYDEDGNEIETEYDENGNTKFEAVKGKIYKFM